ncbi:MAG: SHOCT domain-containing protein [Rhizobiaceae bacterium]|nr:SHOCT domain-containing protein [Rhizobiaceae bacterium]
MNSRKLMRTLSGAAFLVASPQLAFAQDSTSQRLSQDFYGHSMMWSGSHWGGFGMVFGAILFIAFLTLSIVAAVLILRFFGISTGGLGSSSTRQNAITILKERLANGDIDEAEFEERKRLIES